ncbi:MAG: hypothetical protein L3J81_06155, partial [Thermoplasmata archaeon]|nr:hypothetical protein [Thermoplasmata archaeon]
MVTNRNIGVPVGGAAATPVLDGVPKEMLASALSNSGLVVFPEYPRVPDAFPQVELRGPSH